MTQGRPEREAQPEMTRSRTSSYSPQAVDSSYALKLLAVDSSYAESVDDSDPPAGLSNRHSGFNRPPVRVGPATKAAGLATTRACPSDPAH